MIFTEFLHNCTNLIRPGIDWNFATLLRRIFLWFKIDLLEIKGLVLLMQYRKIQEKSTHLVISEQNFTPRPPPLINCQKNVTPLAFPGIPHDLLTNNYLHLLWMNVFLSTPQEIFHRKSYKTFWIHACTFNARIGKLIQWQTLTTHVA